MRRALPVLAALIVAFAAVATATAKAPPGATALCRDGTYSYSKHRAGTCSHHGGVKKWLNGSGSSSGGSIRTGKTILLGHRTKTSGCRRSALPDRRCSPGAYYALLTRKVICGSRFHTSNIRNVPQSEKFAVEHEYGMAETYYGRSLEIDHIVPLELGGSNSIANLFPEPGRGKANYHVKDQLENRLHDLVCSKQLGLLSARRQIASNWKRSYRRIFGHAP
jgi:hypothetical protein